MLAPGGDSTRATIGIADGGNRLVQSGARDGEGDDGLVQPAEPRMRNADADLEDGGRCLALARDDRAHRIGLLCRRDRVRADEHPDQACDGVTEPVPGRSDRDQLGTQPGDEAHARRTIYRADARMTTNATPATRSARELRDERRGERAAVHQLGGAAHADAASRRRPRRRARRRPCTPSRRRACSRDARRPPPPRTRCCPMPGSLPRRAPRCGCARDPAPRPVRPARWCGAERGDGAPAPHPDAADPPARGPRRTRRSGDCRRSPP